ncbi:MAG: hypothetical protein AAFV53_29485 [Myxococcota bacterium]
MSDAPPQPRRRGTFIEDLLTLSVFAFGVIVAAYIYMPDFQRGVWTVADQIALWWAAR